MRYTSDQIVEPRMLITNNWLSQYERSLGIFGSTRDVWKTNLTSNVKSIFFCRLLIETIKACIENKYSCFDAHTTSNCCHGIALMARNALFATLEIDLQSVQILSENKIKELEENPTSTNSFIEWVPEPLIILSGLYLLATVRHIDISKRMRTEARALRNISQIGVEFCWVITHVMQKHFSNIVACSYEVYLSELQLSMNINGAPLLLWGEYVKKEHVRSDKRGIHYVSCVFSEQLSLAYLIESQAKIAIVNDIISFDGIFKDKYIRILEGDGSSGFRPLPDNESYLNLLDPAEPIVVFGGYVRSDSLTKGQLAKKMDPWIYHFPRLLLACDLHYPQFPQVSDDLEFDHAPIIPRNGLLQDIFLQHSIIQGVSASDPSLYCSSHTYIASIGQVVAAAKKTNGGLPLCFHGLQFSSGLSWGMEMFHSLRVATV
jgi:hypothetical protein